MMLRRRLLGLSAAVLAGLIPSISYAQGYAPTATQASRMSSQLLAAGGALVLLALLLIGYQLLTGRGDVEEVVTWLFGLLFLLSAPFIAGLI
jgi:type IV secretory pathway VirB2 component (pilin)